MTASGSSSSRSPKAQEPEMLRYKDRRRWMSQIRLRANKSFYLFFFFLFRLFHSNSCMHLIDKGSDFKVCAKLFNNLLRDGAESLSP